MTLKWRQTQNEDILKNEDDLKHEDDLKNEDNLKKEDVWDTLHKNTSLAAPGHWLTACNATLPAKSKMAARGPKLADRVRKVALLSTFAR